MLSSVILAAGMASRAWPYAGLRQKVTLPVLNTPLIRLLVMNMKEAGVEDVVVVIGHRAQSVKGCLAGLEGVNFVEQRERTGTSDAALIGIHAAKGDHVLISYGDIVTTVANIKNLLDTHQSKCALGVLLTVRSLPSTTIGAQVDVDRSGRVVRLAYRNAANCNRFFGGMMVVKKSCMASCLDTACGVIDNSAGPMPAAESDILSCLNRLCEDEAEIGFMDARDFIVDVDKPWQLVEANFLASRQMFSGIGRDAVLAEGAAISEKAEIGPNVKLVLGPNAYIGAYCRILSSIVMEAGARLDHGVVVRADGGIVVGRNARLENYCLIGGKSVIGPGSHIGHGAEFIGLAFNDVSIKHPAQVCAVLGSNVNIGGGVMTSNWRFDNEVKEQIVGRHRETPEKYGELTFIGDYVRVGNNVTFSPGTRVGAYSCIGSSLWVNEDVQDRSLLLLKQETVRKEWGPDRYGW